MDRQVNRLSEGSAALAIVDFRTTLLGRFLDPRLRVIVGEEVWTFWLERGGRGTRFLVLPAPEKASKVRIEGQHLRALEPIRLLEMVEETAPEGPLLVIAPHPDDAEIAAYGLYRERPETTHIVVVTTGDEGNQYRVGVDRLGGWTAWVRRFDGLAVPMLAGVPAVNVASLDLSERDLTRGAPASTLEELQAQLEEFLLRIRPARVVVPHPVLESHPVHLSVTLATLRAMARTGSNAEALFCLIHPPKATRYPLGPKEGAVPLPPCYDGDEHFDRLLVKRLSAVAQVEKIFALDAHHDLRPAPFPFVAPKNALDSLRAWAKDGASGVASVASRSYIRRAARPYEVFLAVSAEGLPRYVERLEARIEGSRT